MPKPIILEYCILNVAASPHPEGIYKKLFEKAAGNPIRYHGDHFATISKPAEIETGFLQGRVVVWTEIDPNEPAIDKRHLSEIALSDVNFKVPDNLGFNTRSFLYVFRIDDHSLFVEQKNELGKTLSASRSQRIFSHLFDVPILEIDDPQVEITVVPNEDVLERIFGMSTLKRLKIHLTRPNADDEDVQAILDELEEQGAKSQDVLLVSAQGSNGITPNARTRKQAEVAQYNGYVEGVGRDEDNEQTEASTKKHPKIIRKPIDRMGSSFGGILRIAKETIFGAAGG